MRLHTLLAVIPSFVATGVAIAQLQVPLNVTPSQIVGHPNAEQNSSLASGAPNLVEGREMYAPQGIALDTSVTPAILYVSDTNNNRILAWKNSTGYANGAPADLVIGQQDQFTTWPWGPGSKFSTGLYAPTGLAVYHGDLYIADSNNNRILRFPKPFANIGNEYPDLYVGQPNLNSRAANFLGRVDTQGLYLAGSQSFMAFDSTGNLWVSDPGNRRVLRFKAADVTSGGGPLTADLEIGQQNFNTVDPAVNQGTITTKNLFAVPAGIAFDDKGRLFVSDSSGDQNVNRVLVFVPPFSNGMAASRIMGLLTSASTPAEQISRTIMYQPTAIFYMASAAKLGVVDTRHSRIMLFKSYDQWPAESDTYSPTADQIVGQYTVSGFFPNAGQAVTFVPAPNDVTLFYPSAAVFSGTDLYVADTLNHRVVDLPYQNGSFTGARAVLGQDATDMMAPNLIEGREFNFTTNAGLSNAESVAGVAIDSSGDTPHLYVADTYNNRVLGFNDFRKVGPGTKADLVIGQLDFKHGQCNQTGDPDHPNASTLCGPTALLVDSNANLYVADTGNGRVLRFPAPFSHQGLEQADLVLGQRNFTTKITDPSAVTMYAPIGLAFDQSFGLLVSDEVHNRILLFPFNAQATFTAGTDNGKAATKVLGQPDFTTITSGAADNQLSSPHALAVDPDSRPYVVDTGNNRIVIYDWLNNLRNGASASLKIGNLNSPRGMFINQTNGDIWVTDTNNFQVKKYPKFDTLVSNASPTYALNSAGATLAVVQDQFGDVIVADNSNRVSFYYPGLQAINGGNFLTSRALAPGMIASICSPGSACGQVATPVAYLASSSQSASDLPNPLPLPTALGDSQVFFNGSPAPMYYASPTQINFYVPMGASLANDASIQVIQKSTGRILAAGTAPMNTFSPAILQLQFTGKLRQAAVLNQDGSINSPTNPASRGSYISIYATGQGFIPNAPADGSPAGSSPLLNTPYTPRVNIAGIYVEDYPPATNDPPRAQLVYFSGLAPGFVGLWQINAWVPGNVAPGNQVPIFITAGSLPSTDGTYNVTIAVK